MTARRLEIALGVLWLLDGGLQLQPFMLGTGFARQILDPAGDGQPQFVAAPVHWAADVIAAHPVAWDVPFALVQLALGAGLLVPHTARLALVASIPWALGVWYFGEGLGGIASGHASLTTGAPGSALLYAVLAVAALLPGKEAARWLQAAWAALWLGGAALLLLPNQHTAVVPAAAETAIGLGILSSSTRRAAAAAGLAAAVWMWVAKQDAGALGSGQATDPNTGLLIALIAVTLALARKPLSRSPSDGIRLGR